ncbi:MAG: hypothetical protein ACRDLQ_02555, partial [Solirubrobacterales bacterium]
ITSSLVCAYPRAAAGADITRFVAGSIVQQQEICPRCESPGQRFGRRCPRCRRRYWGGGLLRLLFGAGPPMKH